MTYLFEDQYINTTADKNYNAAEIKRVTGSTRDVANYEHFSDLIERTVTKLRPHNQPDRDIWTTSSHITRDEIELRLGNDVEAKKLIFEWSMNELVEHYFESELMQAALLGQGVIGTNASPFDKGTAFVYFHHNSNRMHGVKQIGEWGYMKGGMGSFSKLLERIAVEHGATVLREAQVKNVYLNGLGSTTSSTVATSYNKASQPLNCVELANGTRYYAPVVVSNADPETTLEFFNHDKNCVDGKWRTKVMSIPRKSPVCKVNLAAREIPNFKLIPSIDPITNRALPIKHVHTGQVDICLTKKEWREAYACYQNGTMYHKAFMELYFQSVADPSVVKYQQANDKDKAPVHPVSIFSQYFASPASNSASTSDATATPAWTDEWRNAAQQVIYNSLEKHTTNFPASILKAQVLGPSDVEAQIGIKHGHIFHGDILPQYMWDNRLYYKTPMKGFYLCSAGTNPGGSVMSVNGRNAALQILKEEKI